MLDECTSGLDEAAEATCYSLCAVAGITCVSVGHRPSLARFHTQTVSLGEAEGWSVTTSQTEVGVTAPAGMIRPASLSVCSDASEGSGEAWRVRKHKSTRAQHRFDAVFYRRFLVLFRLGFDTLVCATSVCC